jgi:hypothetical protein
MYIAALKSMPKAVILTIALGCSFPVVASSGCVKQPNTPTATEVKKDAKEALTWAQTLCVFANALLPSPQIIAACNIEEQAAHLVEPFLQAHRMAAQRELAAYRPSASASAAPPASSENVSKAPQGPSSRPTEAASSSAPAASSSAPKVLPPKKK